MLPCGLKQWVTGVWIWLERVPRISLLHAQPRHAAARSISHAADRATAIGTATLAVGPNHDAATDHTVITGRSAAAAPSTTTSTTAANHAATDRAATAEQAVDLCTTTHHASVAATNYVASTNHTAAIDTTAIAAAAVRGAANLDVTTLAVTKLAVADQATRVHDDASAEHAASPSAATFRPSTHGATSDATSHASLAAVA